MANRAKAILLCSVAVAAAGALHAQSSSPQALYHDALAREGDLRRELDAHQSAEDAADLLQRIRTLTGSYEDFAKLFPSSGYSDNALWQGARLSADAFWRIGAAIDRSTALRLFASLTSRFPSSSLARQVPAQVEKLAEAAPRRAGSDEHERQPARPVAASAIRPTVLTAIRREQLPDVLRFTLELEREAPFHSERLDGPPRVFVDLHNTRAADALKDAVLAYSDDAVKQIRVGRHIDARTRVVLDLQDAGRHSVYALYNPYRVVIDFERSAEGRVADTRPAQPVAPSVIGAASAPIDPPRIEQARTSAADPARGTARAEGPAPTAPTVNSSGGFSLSRQLGLGIARVVIDPGHGGHDPGTKVRDLTEANMVLDVAVRLEKLLLAQPGVEVVLTRRTDTYVPLEERTDIANRSSADLFLSIHVNASASRVARGIETYFLNFAPNAAAEAVAARENAGSVKTMRNLPEIVRAIALSNKIDESRDFATMVQAMLYERLRKVNRGTKNLGVKQAPFMVLIGATMPSVLAEIAFLTNRQDAGLLTTDKYRQQIADALFAGIQRYQQSLKKVPAIATQ